jgi:choline-sulfatase
MLASLVLQAAALAPNVVLVTIDTLRADRVGAYGHAGAETRTIDRLAREGVLVLDAVVQVPQTRPSHASIFTGRYPYEHGIRDNYSAPLAAATPTLASILRQQGWDTAAFIGAYPVSRPSGLDRGFAVFDDPFAAGDTTTRQARTERRAREVVDKALAWLARPRTGPFFAWLHLFDPHAPYEAPAPYGPRHARDPYDGEVAYADAQLGRVLAWLDEKGLRQRTLVVVTSDHGEGLGEHGEDEHMFFVYDSTLRVPLVFSWPSRLPAGARVRGQFRSVDLLATLLELAGVPAPPTSGASRAAELRSGGRIPDNESYAESLYAQLHFGYAPVRALRGEGWKLIDVPRPELYRLADDPRETRNLADERSTVAAAMRTSLQRLDRPSGAPPQLPAVDEEASERLAALGYVGGGPAPGGPPSGVDLKDRIGEVQAYTRGMREGIRLYRAREFEGAIRLLRGLSETQAPSFNVQYYLGRSLLDERRFAEAIPYLRKAAEMAPTRRTLSGLAAAPIYAYLVEAYAGAGQTKAAMDTLEQALQVAPANAELLRAKGGLLLQQGRLPEARAALEKARSIDPGEARLHAELSNVYRNLGDLTQARAEAREALRRDTSSPEAHLASGLALGALGLEAEAGAAFRETLRLSPSHPDALFYLGSVELRAGRPAEALPLLEKLLAKAPEYPQGRETLALARRLTAPPPEGSVQLRLLRVAEREKAERLARRLAAGESFAALARSESKDASAAVGGDLGNVRVEELASPLRAAAAALAPGQVSPVLQTDAGYVLLRRER